MVKAMGPFTRTPTPIATQPRTGRPSHSHSTAAATQAARALSKMTVREYPETSGIVASARAASQPAAAPQRRRAQRPTSTREARVNSHAGSRAARSVGPSTSIAAAAAAK
jgi:hypothetical protein